MLTLSLLLAAAAAVVVYQRARAERPPELGTVSAQWLAEQRASGRP
jgi:hypothetical protein